MNTVAERRERIISLALVDDHKIVTDSLKSMLLRKIPCRVLFTSRNGRDMLRQYSTMKPDIIILDIQMGQMDGLEALKRLREIAPDQKVIVLSMFDDDGLVSALAHLKVNCYLSKSGPAEELILAIQKVSKFGFHFTENFVAAMYRSLAEIPDKFSFERNPFSQVSLNSQEYELMRMICNQATTKEIANTLQLNVRTVEGRRRRLFKKIGARNVAGLMIYAVRNGVVKY